MIVIGIDPHKQTHTAAALVRATGELCVERTVKAREAGHGELLLWARSLDQERVWALEDCRHVSGSLERFLLGRGERVVRVPPKLMAQARRGGRRRGKSDAIDALAVARAFLREPELPAAFLAEQERGCGTLTAAKLVGDLAGVRRFAGDAKLAKHTGTAPLEASSGERQRHRLNRSGNRQLNCALHRIATTQARMHPPARAYLERKQAEGKSRREALRCLKRHLARTVYNALKDMERSTTHQTATQTREPALT